MTKICSMHSRTDRLYAQMFNRLRFKSLQVFMSAYESRSIRATSALLGMSQSATTKKIQEVEAAVGEELFTRTVNGLEPTAAGAATYGACQRLASATREWASTLASMRNGEGMRLALGFSSGFFTAEMQGLLNGLNQAVPMLNLSVTVSSGRDISEALKRGSIDWAFGLSDDLNTDYITRPAQPVHLALVVDPHHPLLNELAPSKAIGEMQAQADLSVLHQKGLQWILPPDSDPMRAAFEHAGLAKMAGARLEVSNLHEGLALLRGTAHVMLTTREAARANTNTKPFAVIQIAPEVRLAQAVVAYSRHHKLTPADGYLQRSLTELADKDWRAFGKVSK